MMQMTRRALMGATAAGVALTALGCARRGDSAAELTALLDRLSTETLKESPETATALGVSEEQAGGRFNNRLTDASRENFIRQRDIAQRYVTELESIDRAQLEGQNQVTYDVVLTSLQNQVAGQQFEFGGGAQSPYVVTQLGGAYVNYPDFLDSRHALTNRSDVEGYIARLSGYATVLDQESAMIAQDAGAGMIPPDFCIDGAMSQLDAFARNPPAQTVLVRSLVRRLPEVAEVPEADRAAILTQAETIVRDNVLPAYRRQIEALRAVGPRAVHDAGIGSRPQGAEMYATALRNYTTTTMTADEIHDMGVELVNSTKSQIEAILQSQGLTRGTVNQRIQALGERPDQRYPNTDAGRAQLLADLNAQVAAIRARMPEMFGRLARADLEIVRVPPYIEAGSPDGYYQPPTLDGSRPGAYYIICAARRRSGPNTRCRHSPITKAFQVITGNFRFSRKQKGCRSIAARSVSSARLSRVGVSTLNSSPTRWACMPTIRSAAWAISTPPSSAPRASLSIPGFTQRAGAANRRSNPWAKPRGAAAAARSRRSNAIASSPARHAATWWAAKRSTACATAHVQHSAIASTSRASTTHY